MMTSQMNLRQLSKKQLIKKAVIGLVVILVAFFLLKVGFWEMNYINEKVGAPRAEATAMAETEVDETEVSEQQVVEHVVPADHPRYLTINSLGIIRARILSVGTTNSGELATPTGIFDAGWYSASSKPGEGGTIVLDGHNGGPTKVGIFKNLPNVQIGDEIIIERGDGKVFRYEVVENETVALSDANDYMSTAFSSPQTKKESLTIITCTGEWSSVQKTYLSRQFLRAVLK